MCVYEVVKKAYTASGISEMLSNRLDMYNKKEVFKNINTYNKNEAKSKTDQSIAC